MCFHDLVSSFFMSLHMEIQRYHFDGGGLAKEDKAWNKRSLLVYCKENNFLSKNPAFSWAFWAPEQKSNFLVTLMHNNHLPNMFHLLKLILCYLLSSLVRTDKFAIQVL